MHNRTWMIIGLIIFGGLMVESIQAAPAGPEKMTGAVIPNASPCSEPDPYEGAGGGPRDDTFATASGLEAPDGQAGHTFDLLADEDWAQFTAEAGVLYTLATSNLIPPYDPEGFFADTVLELYGPDGVTFLEENDDFGGTYASRLDWVAAESGNYYVRVYNYNPVIFGCEVGYDLEFSLAGTPDSVPLEIDKSVEDLNGEPLYEQDILRYTIVVANPSQVIARTGVVITDPIPAGTTVLPNSLSVSATSGDWLVIDTDPVLEVAGASLSPLNTVTITFEVQVNAGTAGQSISNRAHVTADEMARQSTPPVTTAVDGLVFPDPDPDPDPSPPTIYLPIIGRNH